MLRRGIGAGLAACLDGLDAVSSRPWQTPQSTGIDNSSQTMGELTVKAIVGSAITLGALLSAAGVAHADADSDYINSLRSHGLSPTPGISESQWEASAIKAAHDSAAWPHRGRPGMSSRRNMPPKTLIT